MHGLINKSIQSFLQVNYGDVVWEDVAATIGVPSDGFESMMVYPDDVTDRLLSTACDILQRDEVSLLEDIGIFLVTQPALEPVRRLMRFGGPTFEDFILSLDEVHDRAALAVPDLKLPRIRLKDTGNGSYILTSIWSRSGAMALVSGIVRAMADDYGALAVFDPGPSRKTAAGVEETLSVFVAEHEFAEGRTFLLGESVA